VTFSKSACEWKPYSAVCLSFGRTDGGVKCSWSIATEPRHAHRRQSKNRKNTEWLSGLFVSAWTAKCRLWLIPKAGWDAKNLLPATRLSSSSSKRMRHAFGRNTKQEHPWFSDFIIENIGQSPFTKPTTERLLMLNSFGNRDALAEDFFRRLRSPAMALGIDMQPSSGMGAR